MSECGLPKTLCCSSSRCSRELRLGVEAAAGVVEVDVAARVEAGVLACDRRSWSEASTASGSGCVFAGRGGLGVVHLDDHLDRNVERGRDKARLLSLLGQLPRQGLLGGIGFELKPE